MPIANTSRSPRLSTILPDLATNHGSHDLFPLWILNLLEWLTELKETLMLTHLLKDMIRDTDEQPDEEVHRVRSGRGPSTSWASVPAELGYITPPTVDVFASVEAPQTPSYWGFMDFNGGLLM